MEERHYLIGTAGHVDHGKTELIRALTGIETDRLKEEKQRGISIELGFAHMVLPSGRQVGIVDVPGHERFVRQMLAGASGMDIVLLVIAADEGVMPQTREHLNILTLLGISNGIVVLSKIDLVDSEWKELIQEEIREDLKDTIFAESPIYPVSAISGEGIPELINVLDDLLINAESKKSDGSVRMPIDRVFSMQGFGTIVTGTLHSGTLELGQEIKIEPQGFLTKVRSLHVHGQKKTKAYAGQRIAANLTGVNVEEVQRGAVLATPNVYRVGSIIDLKVKYLSDDKPLVQRQRVRFHLGTAEVLGRIHLLEHEELTSGHEGFAQVILEEPLLAAPGDHFVLRFYSPAHTIAGGKILGVADHKLKRFKENVIALMTLKDKGNPEELLERELENPLTLTELESSFHMPAKELKTWLQQLLDQERLDVWSDEGVELFWAKKSSDRWHSRLVGTVKAYQKSYPLRGGIGREELKTKLGIDWPHRRWQQILEIGAKRFYYKLIGSKVSTVDGTELPEAIKNKVNCLRRNWENSKLMPPDLETKALECSISKNEAMEYALYLIDQEELIQVSSFFFVKKDFEAAKYDLINYLKSHEEITVGEARELWQTSRKYTVPLLEYFDEIKVTRRQGDKRILGPSGQ